MGLPKTQCSRIPNYSIGRHHSKPSFCSLIGNPSRVAFLFHPTFCYKNSDRDWWYLRMELRGDVVFRWLIWYPFYRLLVLKYYRTEVIDCDVLLRVLVEEKSFLWFRRKVSLLTQNPTHARGLSSPVAMQATINWRNALSHHNSLSESSDESRRHSTRPILMNEWAGWQKKTPKIVGN